MNSSSAQAAIPVTCPDGYSTSAPTADAADRACDNHQGSTGGATSAPTPNAPTGANFKGDCKSGNIDKSNCGIIAYLITAINILSGLVGVVVVVMIAIGGIQYSTSRDNPQATAAAKDRIRNAIIALVAYIFMWAFLQYLIPGGVL